MADTQAIVVLHLKGWSARRIARELGMDRETVGRYIQLHQQADSKPASAPLGPDPVINAASSAAEPWRAVILEKLQQGLGVRRIYQDLTGPQYGYSGSYYSVRRLAARLSEHRELPVRRMHSAPGMEAQVDFGRGA
jgi:IS30 family transposase